MLSVCKSWFPRGSGQQFKVRTRFLGRTARLATLARWGLQGRINLIGTLTLNAHMYSKTAIIRAGVHLKNLIVSNVFKMMEFKQLNYAR